MSQIKKYIDNNIEFEKLPRVLLIENVHVYDHCSHVAASGRALYCVAAWHVYLREGMGQECTAGKIA